MTSTITIVDAALADWRSGQARQHSRRDGSEITTASGVSVSGASGNVLIGHIDELEEDEYSSIYSEDDEMPDGNSEGQVVHGSAGSRDRLCMRPCSNKEDCNTLTLDSLFRRRIFRIQSFRSAAR